MINAVNSWIYGDQPQKSLVYGGGDAGKQIAEKLAEVELKFHKTIIY